MRSPQLFLFDVYFVQELGLIPTPATAVATAAFLKGTLLLDKSMLGEYLSRGPRDKYPFNAEVRVEHGTGRSRNKKTSCRKLC